MQDGAIQHISKSMMQLSKKHSGNDRIIRHHFLTVVVLSGTNVNVAELKTRIPQHIHNVTPETLQSIVRDVFYKLQLADNMLNMSCAN